MSNPKVVKVERVIDPAREAEKKRLYSTNRPGAPGDNKFWAVARGKSSGVLVGWDRVLPLITNCKKPICYSSFNSEAEAWAWLTETKKKLQRKIRRTLKVTKTRPIPGKKGEEEEYETEENYSSFEDTSEEEVEKGAPRRPAPPPPPKKYDETNVDTTWMGSQRYVTDKVWLVEEEQQAEEEEQLVDVDLTNTVVGKSYNVGNTVGRGAFAIVKSGQKGGAQFALKILSKQIIPDFDLGVAKTELAALQAVKGHPNIVNVVEHFEIPNGFVIAMELLGSELFRSLANDNKPYHEDEAQKFVRQIVSAVDVIHSKGYVHRDIVPENLLLTKTGDVKLVGFSMVKEIKDSLPFDGLVGTPALQAPEVIMRQSISKVVDLWSIGCITYALLSGAFPFHDSNVMRLNIKIRKAEYDVAGPSWGPVSAAAKDFLKATLNPNAKDRLTAQQAKEHPWLKNNAPHTALPTFRANVKSSVDNNSWN